MLQRIQTIWYLLASIAILGLFLTPYLHFNTGLANAEIKITGYFENDLKVKDFQYFNLETILLAILPIFLMFNFGNRKKQILYSYVVIAAILGYCYLLMRLAKSVMGSTEVKLENLTIGSALPSIAIVCIILAIKAIRKDEKLVRSADRLR